MRKVIGDTVVARQPGSDDCFYLRVSRRTQYGDSRGTKGQNTQQKENENKQSSDVAMLVSSFTLCHLAALLELLIV